MYNIVTIADLIQILPQDYEKRSARALEDNINAKYANKVIHKIGLAVGLFDILKFSEGLIGHGTGIVNVHVDFRLIVFRPFKGEILQGRIMENTPYGLRITMDFFDDIWVPAPGMTFENTQYDKIEEEGQAPEWVWIWHAEESGELYFDNNETVRFRVEAESWTDLEPKRAPDPTQESLEVKTEDVPEPSPYTITASMQQSGLGPILWWSE
ncbi:DNA-directed RNA polymerase III subunit rpc25 [Elsinoe australis]|uniref:DNA-directed RNA polymerase subunit n=1 Tax=Elsinoe australis TaxID=40998 RepID=A0A2P8A5K1_9PEZI|nr:DNA-directed RNA polymerase [Elsinoe australis]TKX25573.1 DNA-directed RNA polymerase III subunit rpc25 [Elsinoe australis]